MVRGEGLSPQWGALLWLFVGVGGVSGVATGAAVGRFGLGNSLRAAIAVMAASIAGLAVSPSNAGTAALAAVAFGVAYMPFAALLAIWNQRLHPRHATSGLVLSLFSLGVGAVVGPAVMGVIAQNLGVARRLLDHRDDLADGRLTAVSPRCSVSHEGSAG